MKRSKVFTTALLLSITAISFNCSPDQDLKLSTKETLVRNGWAVDYYYQQQDITSEFGNYRLIFNTAGTIFLRKNNESVSGNWNRTTDVNQKEIVGININTSNPSLNKLNDSWELISQTSTTMTFGNSQDPVASVLRIRIQL